MNKRNLFSYLRRTYSKLLVEALREIRRITESYGIAYLAHLHVALGKQLGGLFESHYLYHVVGRHVGKSLYLGKESRPTNAHLVGKEVDIEVGIGEILLNYLLHTFKEILIHTCGCNLGDRF